MLDKLLYPFTKAGHVTGPVIILLIVLGGVGWGLLNQPLSGPFDKAPLRMPASPASCHRATVPQGVKVANATSAAATMNIFVGRDGNRQQGESTPLLITGGKLCPRSVWPMHVPGFSRSGDLHGMNFNQVISWARVNNSGTAMTVWVLAAPHFPPQSTGAGLYTGTIVLDSAQVTGASVAVRVHVQYQNLNLVLAFGFLAAFAGFIWALLLHSATGGVSKSGYFFRYFALCLAVLLAATVPVINVQVLSKPDWQGSLSEYIGLATLIGAAAIALTPTLRALVLPRGLPDSSEDKRLREGQAEAARAAARVVQPADGADEAADGAAEAEDEQANGAGHGPAAGHDAAAVPAAAHAAGAHEGGAGQGGL